MDGGSGVGGEVGEELRDAGERGAGFEEVVLGSDFVAPFVNADWHLGPVEEPEHARAAGALLLGLDVPW